jgi:hypothetical protein
MCKVDIKNGDTRIDPCMRQLIEYLNALNVKTIACCCGHFRYPMSIVIESPWDKKPFEVLSKTDIPRKRKFYKRDKQGYYFIPEVCNEK